MNIYTLPRRTRRLLAVGLLAAVVAIPVSAIWLAASVTVFDLDERVGAVERKVSSMTMVSGSITHLRKSLATLERDVRYSVDMLPPVSDTQATAALQSAVQKTISATGAVVRSVLPLDVVEDGAVRRAGVRVVLVGNTNQFNRVLAAIDEVTPNMIVGNSEIRVNTGSRYDVTPGKAPDVQATIDVFAFVRKG